MTVNAYHSARSHDDAKELIDDGAPDWRELDVNLITRGHLERGIDRAERASSPGIFSTETIERYMVESLETLPGTRFDEFVPLLVHRFARERLQALAQAEGTIAKDVPEVLFVCVHNAGRSQMAAALLDRYAEGRVHVRSAGSTPADEINPEVVDGDGRARRRPRQGVPQAADRRVRRARQTS